MKPGFAKILSDAWRLWRTDWNLLAGVAGLFLILPPLAANLLLSPDLSRAMAQIAPGDGDARIEAMFSWYQSSLPWLIMAQVAIQFGGLAILTLYLAPRRGTVADALRSAARLLPIYLLAMLLVSIVAMAGLFVLLIGFAYALGRLLLVGPIIVAERESNPFAAIGRSVALTRGNGWILTGILILLYCVAIVVQAPFEQIQQWMVIHAPNPVGEAIVSIAISLISAGFFLAVVLVQVAAYRRFTSGVLVDTPS